MLSKIIIKCFVDNLELSELQKFIDKVLTPQKASCLIEHARAAEQIIISQGNKPPSRKKKKNLEQVL